MEPGKYADIVDVVLETDWLTKDSKKQLTDVLWRVDSSWDKVYKLSKETFVGVMMGVNPEGTSTIEALKELKSMVFTLDSCFVEILKSSDGEEITAIGEKIDNQVERCDELASHMSEESSPLARIIAKYFLEKIPVSWVVHIEILVTTRLVMEGTLKGDALEYFYNMMISLHEKKATMLARTLDRDSLNANSAVLAEAREWHQDASLMFNDLVSEGTHPLDALEAVVLEKGPPSTGS